MNKPGKGREINFMTVRLPRRLTLVTESSSEGFWFDVDVLPEFSLQFGSQRMRMIPTRLGVRF
jgi:hypothetical protein